MIPGQQYNTPERRCPNCGIVIPPNVPYCSVCGYGTLPVKKATNTALIVMFVLIGVPAALCGGCFLLTGAGTPGGYQFVIAGLVGLSIFGILLWSLIKSGRQKPPQF